MANTTALSSTQGLLINNPAPLPDGTVNNPNIQTVAAAGTTQLTATALTAPYNVVTNTSTTNGVILPVGSKGQSLTVIVALPTNAQKVYPPAGGTINFGTVGTAANAPAQRETTFRAIDGTGLNWVSGSLTA